MSAYLCGLPKGIINQYLAGFTISISVITAGTGIGWPAASIPILRDKKSFIPMEDWQLSWMVSLMYLGNIISPIPFSFLMDAYGRKSTLMISMVFPIMSWLTILFAQEPYHLYIGRFLFGISLGAVYTIVPVYLMEISETHLRGMFGNSMSVMINLGSLYVYGLGPYHSYDSLALSCLLVPIAFIVCIFQVPEPPQFYLMHQRRSRAEESITWLRCHKSKEEIMDELVVMEYNTKKEMESKGKFIDLVLTPGNRKATIIVFTLAAAQRMTGIGALMAFSSITIPPHSVPGITLKECVMILGFVWFISSIASSLLVERLGRKLLLSISCTGCGISTLAASAWFFLDEKTDVNISSFRWVPFLAFLLHSLFYSFGIGPVGSVIKGELFPVSIKCTASAMTTIVLAMSSFLLNQIYLPIANNYGMYLNFLIFSACCFLTDIFVFFYVLETKGKTIQEIQDELNN